MAKKPAPPPSKPKQSARPSAGKSLLKKVAKLQKIKPWARAAEVKEGRHVMEKEVPERFHASYG